MEELKPQLPSGVTERQLLVPLRFVPKRRDKLAFLFQLSISLFFY